MLRAAGPGRRGRSVRPHEVSVAVESAAATGAGSRPAGRVAAVRLEGVDKRFGDVAAVSGIDLDIGDGEFFSMLGPSGSGKTTTLRMIAGFEEPTAGGSCSTGVTSPASRRSTATSTPSSRTTRSSRTCRSATTSRYGLVVRRVAGDRTTRAGRPRRSAWCASTGYDQRRPAQLSGGQRQRVALARALVNRPRVLLLDEPLGALDLKLREEMQIELKAIQQQVGITFIYVTHDQEEALTMSDRLAVFNLGRIEQVGSPAEVYEHPATTFVAGFVGTSNLLTDAAARSVSSVATACSPCGRRRSASRIPTRLPAPDEGSALGRIREVVYIGPDTRYIVALETGGELVVTQPEPGDILDGGAGHPRPTGPARSGTSATY